MGVAVSWRVLCIRAIVIEENDPKELSEMSNSRATSNRSALNCFFLFLYNRQQHFKYRNKKQNHLNNALFQPSNSFQFLDLQYILFRGCQKSIQFYKLPHIRIDLLFPAFSPLYTQNIHYFPIPNGLYFLKVC